jgi:hypothetical protein
VQRLTIKNLLKHLTFRQLLRQVINNLEEAEHSQQEKSVQFTGLGNGEVNIATQVEIGRLDVDAILACNALVSLANQIAHGQPVCCIIS